MRTVDAKRAEVVRGLSREPLACAQRVRSYLKDPQCALSKAQILADMEVVMAFVQEHPDPHWGPADL